MTLEQLQAAVTTLTVAELASFRAWLRDFELPPAIDTAESELTGDLSPDQLADLAMTRPNDSDAVEGLYRTWLGSDPAVFERVLSIMRARGMTQRAIENLKYRATSLLPFMRQHGLRANVFTVGSVIGALRDTRGNLKTTPCAQALFELLRNENVSQAQAENLRAQYERSA